MPCLRLTNVAALGISALAVLVQRAQAEQTATGSPGAAAPSVNLMAPKFDLGIDISNIPATPAATHQFLLTLPPDVQAKMMNDCQTLLGRSDSSHDAGYGAFLQGAD